MMRSLSGRANLVDVPALVARFLPGFPCERPAELLADDRPRWKRSGHPIARQLVPCRSVK